MLGRLAFQGMRPRGQTPSPARLLSVPQQRVQPKPEPWRCCPSGRPHRPCAASRVEIRMGALKWGPDGVMQQEGSKPQA